MINRYTKLRWRRKIRHQQKAIEQAGSDAGKGFEKHVVRRWRNLLEVRRFVIGWLVLIALLITGVYLQGRSLSAYYQDDIPVAGGIFREGMVGEVTNMNPIFATSPADRAAAKLIFSTLFSYDTENMLVGDIARDWRVNPDGTIYTVKLRQDIFWHDGMPLTADDIVYTYEAVQHPDTRSFLNSSWQDIKVQAKSEFTVTFTLPNPFTPFLHSLAQGGILPEHILGEVDPAQLRGHPFNVSEPVGTGPFEFVEVVTEEQNNSLLETKRHDRYHRGKPVLDGFIIQTYSDREEMIMDFMDGQLTAIAGLRTIDRDQIVSDPDSIWYDMPLNNAVYVFLNNSNGRLSNKNLRKALTQATDQSQIIKSLESRFAEADGPLLRSHLGYKEHLTQAPFNRGAANKLLQQEGWKLSKNGFRKKEGKTLTIDIVTQNSDDYPEITDIIKEQWKKVGVKLNVLVVSPEEIQQNFISTHNYQSLLFGITLGSDPDVYVYWHSSQAGINGFNLSELKNDVVDSSLEQGRTRSQKRIREAKYKTFQEAWRTKHPAIALYQPGFSYVQRAGLDGFKTFRINTPDDRFANVHEWKVNTSVGEKIF